MFKTVVSLLLAIYVIIGLFFFVGFFGMRARCVTHYGETEEACTSERLAITGAALLDFFAAPTSLIALVMLLLAAFGGDGPRPQPPITEAKKMD